MVCFGCLLFSHSGNNQTESSTSKAIIISETNTSLWSGSASVCTVASGELLQRCIKAVAAARRQSGDSAVELCSSVQSLLRSCMRIPYLTPPFLSYFVETALIKNNL